MNKSKAETHQTVNLHKETASEKELLTVTLSSIREGVISTNNTGKIILINEVAERLLECTKKQAIGQNIENVFAIVDENTGCQLPNTVTELMKAKNPSDLPSSAILTTRKGVEKIIAYNTSPMRDQEENNLGMVLVFWNISKQRRLESELIKTHKLESIGFLAGGIAHDFNNILTVISGNITLAKMCCRPKSMIHNRLIEAEKAALLAKEITQQLLTFSQVGAPVKKTTSLRRIILESVSLSLRGSRSNYRLSLPENLWPVEVDSGQMSQVINNLVINAIQAMPSGGLLQIEAENILVESEHHLSLAPGNYVKFSVKDQGVGICKKHLSKIFDPYFTTKPTGSGLGLAICYYIITKHNGSIHVQSQRGKGSVFNVYLPAVCEAVKSVERIETINREGRGKILVMDDQKAVRDITAELVQHLGYQVVCAKNGEEAISIYDQAKNNGQPFDAVIMDLTIAGGMGGKDCIHTLRQIDPEIKAIVSSGYATDPVLTDYQAYGFVGMITKPHTLESLHKVLQKALSKDS